MNSLGLETKEVFFSEGDETNWSHNLNTITEVIKDTKLIYHINYLKDMTKPCWGKQKSNMHENYEIMKKFILITELYKFLELLSTCILKYESTSIFILQQIRNDVGLDTIIYIQEMIKFQQILSKSKYILLKEYIGFAILTKIILMPTEVLYLVFLVKQKVSMKNVII